MGENRDEQEAKHAALQFHLTKVTLAKAALAGVTYLPTYHHVIGRYGPELRGHHDKMTTEYIVVLPDGTQSNMSFADELEGAIWALGQLDPQPPAQPPAQPIEGFVLKPENEQ